MRELCFLLGFHKSSLQPYVVLRRKAGQLFLRQRSGEPDYKAGPGTNWNGWIKLHSRPINDVAVTNKGRVITEVNPDILIVQEIEDRQSLLGFNEGYLSEEVRFSEIYSIEGNDEYSRSMGIMTKKEYRVNSVISHSNEWWKDEKLFDKDLQEYEIRTPKGEILWILSAQMAEPGPDNEEKRKAQSERIAEVYDQLWGRGIHKIAVVGTFNAPSYCDSLSPVLRNTGLQEVKKHPQFNVDFDEGKDAAYHSLGAYKMGVNLKQQDYLLLSPDLYAATKGAGLYRKGVWPAKKDQYRTYSSIEGETFQASSHPALWVEF